MFSNHRKLSLCNTKPPTRTRNTYISFNRTKCMFECICRAPSIIRLHEVESGSLSRFAATFAHMSLCACTYVMQYAHLSMHRHIALTRETRMVRKSSDILHHFGEEVIVLAKSSFELLLRSFNVFGCEIYIDQAYKIFIYT